MPLEVHGVMENSDYIDDVFVPGPVDDDMPPRAAMTADMQRADSWAQIVAGNTSENRRACVEFGESIKDYRFVDDLLTRAKSVAGIGEDANEIFFRLRAEDNAPRFLNHDGSRDPARAFAPTVLR